MNYAVEMGLGAMTYMPSFIKVNSGIQKLMGGGDTRTDRQEGDLICLLLLFQYKKSMLKTDFVCTNLQHIERKYDYSLLAFK
jgi:hypothetical protein